MPKTRKFTVIRLGWIAVLAGAAYANFSDFFARPSTSASSTDSSGVTRKIANDPPLSARLLTEQPPQKASPSLPAADPNRAAASPPSSAASDPSARTRPTDRYANERVIAAEETDPDANGRFRRRRILETRRKYPLLLVEDELHKNADSSPTSSGEELLHQSAMVADHLLVKLKPSQSPEDFEARAPSLGLRIERRLLPTSVYIVSFDASTPGALEAMQKKVLQSGWVSSAEPDRIITKSSFAS